MTKQAERLENWSQDFAHFFGWPTNVSDKKLKTVVDISAPRFDYIIEAEGNSLHCMVSDRKSGQQRDVAKGDFDFLTFGKIMMHILHYEASRKRLAALNFLKNLKRSDN